MQRTFSTVAAALVLSLFGVGFSQEQPGATPTDAQSEPVVGKLVEKSAELPVPKARQFFQVSDELDDAKTEKIGYQLFLPTDESAKTEDGFPLLLFLHGIGERGNDLKKLKIYGPTKICDDPEQASKWPFILVAPQCPESHFWSAAQLRLLVEDVCENYPVDKNRIYVTGLSMGGFGTWAILGSWPELVAAAAPICGGGNPELADKMKNVPVWAFHGEKDPLVPCRMSEAMVDALKKAGNEDARLTTYPGVGHDSWVKAYADPELYKWLLSKKLKSPEASE